MKLKELIKLPEIETERHDDEEFECGWKVGKNISIEEIGNIEVTVDVEALSNLLDKNKGEWFYLGKERCDHTANYIAANIKNWIKA